MANVHQGSPLLTVVGCLVEAHDLRLVVLAAAICALSALTTVCLVSHARRASGWMQAAWLAVAAGAGGSGIWATHFIAMLAFAPGIPGGYDIALTALSLVIAVVLLGCGLSVAVLGGSASAAWCGGAILGLGIPAMHYTGMAAYDVAGPKAWDPIVVAVSLALGAVLGGAALAIRFGGRGIRRQLPRCLASGAGDLRPPLYRHEGCGLPVLAEGVETAAELDFILAEHCHAAQGYLMGRPSHIGEFGRFTHGAEPVLVDAQKVA